MTSTVCSFVPRNIRERDEIKRADTTNERARAFGHRVSSVVKQREKLRIWPYLHSKLELSIRAVSLPLAFTVRWKFSYAFPYPLWWELLC